MTHHARVRLAAALWILFAFVAWNVIFDRVLVLAGRRYVFDASTAARHGRFIRIDDTMRPAIRRGVVLASSVAVPIALLGVGVAWFAGTRYRRSTRSK